MNLNRPIESGVKYLEKQLCRGNYVCEIGSTRELLGSYTSSEEVGSSLLVLNTIATRLSSSNLRDKLVDYSRRYLSKGRIHFFADPTLLPSDTETTSYGLSTLLELREVNPSLAMKTAQQIVSNTDERGLVKIYFEPCNKVNKVDHVAAANVMYFVNQMGLRDTYSATEEWCEEVLREGAYLDGSRYYHSPDAMIYFLARAIDKFPILGERFGNNTIDALHHRIGNTDYPLDLAMRVSSAKRLGLCTQEEGSLKDIQQADGSWPKDAIYHYGGRLGYFGSSVISTAFALEAIGL